MIPNIFLLTWSVSQVVDRLFSPTSANSRALVWNEQTAGALAAPLSSLLMCALQKVHVIS